MIYLSYILPETADVQYTFSKFVNICVKTNQTTKINPWKHHKNYLALFKMQYPTIEYCYKSIKLQKIKLKSTWKRRGCRIAAWSKSSGMFTPEVHSQLSSNSRTISRSNPKTRLMDGESTLREDGCALGSKAREIVGVRVFCAVWCCVVGRLRTLTQMLSRSRKAKYLSKKQWECTC